MPFLFGLQWAALNLYWEKRKKDRGALQLDKKMWTMWQAESELEKTHRQVGRDASRAVVDWQGGARLASFTPELKLGLISKRKSDRINLPSEYVIS